MGRIDNAIKSRREFAENRQAEVIKAIKLMRKKNENITFYSVAQKTGASKSYLYKNPQISALITKNRGYAVSDPSPVNAREITINWLNRRIRELESENAFLKSTESNSLEEKCSELEKENRELRENLRRLQQANVQQMLKEGLL